MTVDPRRLPRTDAVLADPLLASARLRFKAGFVKSAVHDAQALARAGDIAASDVASSAAEALGGLAGIVSVINATGVVLHTNLGRAALSPAAIDAMVAAAANSSVEFDLSTGSRGRRGASAVSALAALLPDAGGHHVVNNGAAALILAVTVLAQGREILISRGEMIEIGDGFRLPDLLVSTGARLREVGTTNRTHLPDYRDAIGPETAAILKVHPSNFRITGFTAGVDIAELSSLGLPVIADVGSGLLDPDPLLPDEPTVSGALRAGASLVTCSGDKLLGGPQSGLLAGNADLVEACRRHPLARALRVDKLTLAALEATLRGLTNPTEEALHIDLGELRARTERLQKQVGGTVVATTASVGGGGAPGVELPSIALALDERMASVLRTATPPVIGRVSGGRCLLDLRTVPAEFDAELAAIIDKLAH